MEISTARGLKFVGKWRCTQVVHDCEFNVMCRSFNCHYFEWVSHVHIFVHKLYPHLWITMGIAGMEGTGGLRSDLCYIGRG